MLGGKLISVYKTKSSSISLLFLKHFLWFLLISGENTELTSRLQTVRQKAAELEKNLANVTASCDKYQDVSISISESKAHVHVTCNFTDNIHEKITQFLLAESSAKCNTSANYTCNSGLWLAERKRKFSK